MNFLDLAKKRYSVRKYEAKAVEQEKIDTVLEAGRICPTAANLQPNHFLVIEGAANLTKLSKGTDAHQAPLAIIVCANKNNAWVRPYDKHSMVDIDATIATDHMMLCAQDLGLSSCWLTYFNPEIICEEFNIPSHIVPVNILALGYSADTNPQSPNRHDKTRKKLSEMVTYGSF